MDEAFLRSEDVPVDTEDQREVLRLKRDNDKKADEIKNLKKIVNEYVLKLKGKLNKDDAKEMYKKALAEERVAQQDQIIAEQESEIKRLREQIEDLYNSKSRDDERYSKLLSDVEANTELQVTLQKLKVAEGKLRMVEEKIKKREQRYEGMGKKYEADRLDYAQLLVNYNLLVKEREEVIEEIRKLKSEREEIAQSLSRFQGELAKFSPKQEPKLAPRSNGRPSLWPFKKT